MREVETVGGGGDPRSGGGGEAEDEVQAVGDLEVGDEDGVDADFDGCFSVCRGVI